MIKLSHSIVTKRRSNMYAKPVQDERLTKKIDILRLVMLIIGIAPWAILLMRWHGIETFASLLILSFVVSNFINCRIMVVLIRDCPKDLRPTRMAISVALHSTFAPGLSLIVWAFLLPDDEAFRVLGLYGSLIGNLTLQLVGQYTGIRSRSFHRTVR